MKRVRREYQKVALVAVRKVRQIALYWARRCRKSTTLGEIGFDEMSSGPGHMVIAASASLLLGKELVGVTLSAVEQGMIVANEAAAVREVFETGAGEKALDFKVADSAKDKVMHGLSAADFAELYQSSRMELRLYFTKTTFSRLQVIAPNPATARSWRALVVRDEAGFTNPNFETELRNATDPMMRDTPDLKMIYASNLSTNDRHPYFGTTMPREIDAATEDEQFPANPSGHLYIGQDGILVHRVALKDAYAAGHLLYDDHGTPMSYEECQVFPQFKSGWDPTYALNHKSGGTSAIDLFALLNGQQRGLGQCVFAYIDSDAEFQRAMHALRAVLGRGRIGAGYDPATTIKATSNPSSITITEENGTDRIQRLVILWKERKAQIVIERIKTIFRFIQSRPEGGQARRFCILATNERYFADMVSDELRGIVPVELVIESATLEPPGYDAPVNYKTYLGDIYSAAVNDNRYLLPGGEYFKRDQRMTTKNAGRYECTPEPDGAHGDTFASGGVAEYALTSRGDAIGSSVAVRPHDRAGRAGSMGSRRNIGGML